MANHHGEDGKTSHYVRETLSTLAWEKHLRWLKRDSQESADPAETWSECATRLGRRLLIMAKDRSPFWQGLLHEIDPRDASWHMFPVVDREMFTRNLNDTFTDRRLSVELISRCIQHQEVTLFADDYVLFYSLGASQQGLYYVYEREAWATYGAALLRAIHLAGASTSMPTVLLGSNDIRHTLPRLAPLFPSGTVIGLQDGVSTAWRKLEAVMPLVLIGYSSAIAMAARAQLNRALRICPQYVVAGNDYLSESDRDSIRAAWGIDACVYYSTTEAGIIASQCSAAGSLHVNQDHVFVENLREDLLVTQLINRPQPAVRYRLPERGRILTGTCPCGSAMPRLVINPGRTRNPLIFGSATGRYAEVHPIVIRSALDGLGTGLTAAWSTSEQAIVITGQEQHLSAARMAVERALIRAGVHVPVTIRSQAATKE